jgi:two-component sensor histidine kinase/ABC-type amino acid transport substrate-binding protein
MIIGKILQINMLRCFFILLLLFTVKNLNAQSISFTEEERDFLREHPVIYFGYDPYWPPYEIYSNGKYSGVCADYLKIIEKKIGVKFMPLKNLTWEKSFDLLKKNQLMMVPGAGISEERKKFLIFTENYVRLPWVIVTKKGNSKYKKLIDLNYKKISIPKDYMQMDLIPKEFPKIKIITRNNFEECLQDVSLGITDATVGSVGTITYFINQTGSYDLSISGYSYDKHSVAFAFPKQQTVLRNIVQKALKSISLDERNKINSKWVSIHFDENKLSKTFWTYLIVIVIVLIVVFAIVLLWNKSLRKQVNLRKNIEIELSKTLDEVNKQNNDKTVLLQEIHHRVKNNLQIIISLLRLQSNSNPNKDTQNALNEAIDRINSISLVHEHIYKNPNLAEIELAKYIHDLGEELKRVFVKDKDVYFDIKTNQIQLNIKSIIPIALILNELITNSLKYAFRNREEGVISISFSINTDKTLKMHYVDNGEWYHNEYTKNFGTYLIDIFTEQLSGSYSKLDKKHASYEFKFVDL